jgi:hypothetical protein
LPQCRSITQRDWSPEDSTRVIDDENARNSIAIAIQSIDASDDDDIYDTDDADLHESGRCFSYQCVGGNIRPTDMPAIPSLDGYALSIATNRSTAYSMLVAPIPRFCVQHVA